MVCKVLERDRGERMEHSKRFLTVEDVAKEVGVHPQTVRRWLREGRIEGTLITRAAGYRIPAKEVERVLTEGLREGHAGKVVPGHNLAA